MNKHMLKAWFPDKVDIEIMLMAQGNTTETCQVKVDGQKWILRKLSSVQQAEWEYQIAKCLQQEKIVPQIVCARSGLNYTQIGEKNLSSATLCGRLQNSKV